jgi:molybdopterin molybdotransferase
MKARPECETMAEVPRLTSLADALAVLLMGLDPVAPTRLAVREALGLPAAETIRAPAPVPAHPIAQRDGIAVASLALVGASLHMPVLLTEPPAPAYAGEVLPDGTDAVLPRDAAAGSGPLFEIGQAAYPGENATLAGADLAVGETILSVGEIVTPERCLALELAGIGDIAMRRVTFALHTANEDAADCHWLQTALARLGARRTPEDEADAVLALADPKGERPGGHAGLALRPGGTAAVIDSGLLVLPARFDGVVAAFYALVLPLIARLTARAVNQRSRPLTRKISSMVGFTDIVLLRSTSEGYEPLSVGQVTLSALIAADAVALIPPESEGAAAGTLLSAIPMNAPLAPA